jgi:uncharacterized membrane protein
MFTKADAEAYFNAEKSATLLFIIIGVAAIVLAAISFFVLKTNFYKGLAIPLLLLGIVEAAIGYTVYSRTDRQRQDIVYKMDLDPYSLQQKEIPRMQKVVKNFTIYRVAELVFLIAGLFLFLYYRKNEQHQLWAGVGIALAIQAIILFAADTMAEKRAKTYFTGLIGFVKPKS